MSNVDGPIDDYLEFGMPIFERLGDLRLSLVRPSESDLKRAAGCSLTTMSL